MKWTKNYIAAIQAALGNMDFATIEPFSHLQFQPLIAKEWVKKLRKLMRNAKEQEISHKELAYLWPTTSAIRCQLLFALLMMKCAQTPKDQRKEIAQFFYDMIKERAVTDVNGTHSNVSRSAKELKELFQMYKFDKGTAEDAKLLGKLYNALYNLSAGFFLDFYLDYPAENEGPYDVSNIYGPGHILVVKRFIDLQVPFWDQTDIDAVEIYCVYKNVEFSCDLIAIHSMYKGDVINNLVEYTIIVNGKQIKDKDKIKDIMNNLSTASVQQWIKLKNLDKTMIQEQGARIHCYGMRRLFKRVGMSWEPSKQMLEDAKQTLKDNKYWQIPKGNKEEYWNKIYDPEIDFYPGENI